MRNMIAHNKPICLELRRDIIEQSEELERTLLRKMENLRKKFKSTEEEHIKELYRDIEKELTRVL
jgi:hypothetical protein